MATAPPPAPVTASVASVASLHSERLKHSQKAKSRIHMRFA